MPTFLPGSSHGIKIQLGLPLDYEKDEDDLPIGFWLENVKGKRFDIMGESPSIRWEGGENVRLYPLIHLTKNLQVFTFETTMPKRQGKYKLKANITPAISDMESTEVTIKK